jgi:hypothetical protein
MTLLKLAGAILMLVVVFAVCIVVNLVLVVCAPWRWRTWFPKSHSTNRVVWRP